MELLKKAWNWKPSRAVSGSARFRALRLIAGLLAVMACCTLISRVAASVTTPVVTVEEPRRTTILHRFSLDGAFEATGGTPVMAEAGYPVSSLPVSEGDHVRMGDLLFTLDLSSLADTIAEKRVELQKLELELSVLRQNAERAGSGDELALERAAEDLEALRASSDIGIMEAGQKLRIARVNLRKYDDVDDDDYGGDYTEAEYLQLREAVRAAELAYEKAQADRDEALRKAQRGIDDLNAEKDADASIGLKSLDITAARAELSGLLETAGSGGEVFAPADGVISGLSVKLGGTSPQSAAAILRDTGGMRYRAGLTEEQKKYVEEGDSIALSLPGESEKLADLTVSAIIPAEGELGRFTLFAELPGAGGLSPGQNAAAEIRRRSRQYDTCIPLSALLGGENEYYVLALREVQTATGAELIAEEVPVTLLERNEDTAAVSGAILPDTELIVDTTKPVRGGDRVRKGS